MATKYKLQPTAEFANKSFGESDEWDSADFAGLEPAGSTPEGLKWQKIKDVYDQNFPKIVDAASEDEALSIYKAMIQDMDASGLKDVESYLTKAFQDRMKLWGTEK
jgi:putative aldouronate transport system substrate-binding protein